MSFYYDLPGKVDLHIVVQAFIRIESEVAFMTLVNVNGQASMGSESVV